jgi:hypothetical protein
MKRMRRHIAATVMLACTIGIAHSAEKLGKPTTLPRGMFQAKVTKDYLTLEANEAPLAKVFEEIGKQAGIVVDNNLGPEEKITIQLNHVALDEALNRLARNITILYAQVPNDKGRRITRVIVLAEGTKPPPKRTEASTESTKTIVPAPQQPPAKRVEPPSQSSKTEATPRPPPFKFEFDPAASMKKP